MKEKNPGYPREGWFITVREDGIGLGLGRGKCRIQLCVGTQGQGLVIPLKATGEQPRAKGCWKLPLKDYHSFMLENEFYLFNSHKMGLFPGYKGSQGFLLAMLAVTDLATWRSAGPTAGGTSLLLLQGPHISRRQIASAVPRLAGSRTGSFLLDLRSGPGSVERVLRKPVRWVSQGKSAWGSRVRKGAAM